MSDLSGRLIAAAASGLGTHGGSLDLISYSRRQASRSFYMCGPLVIPEAGAVVTGSALNEGDGNYSGVTRRGASARCPGATGTTKEVQSCIDRALAGIRYADPHRQEDY